MSKLLIVSLLTVLLILYTVQAHETESTHANENSTAPKIDCVKECNRRCSLSSRQKMCLRSCKTCCQRCNCVPPGTAGNQDVCPCYEKMTTHGGRKKCP